MLEIVTVLIEINKNGINITNKRQTTYSTFSEDYNDKIYNIVTFKTL